MTEQRTSPDEMSKFMRDVVPLWMKLIFGGVTLLMAALAAISVLRHGTKNLGFLFMTLSMAGLLFFMDQPTHPIKAYLKRPQGFLYLLWVAVTIVWYMRDVGWLPAVCIGGAYLFAPL
ncbi:MAG TPA: hypothetical protein VGU90_00475, partial [Terriglobales bacterium]|nr:hypothetical protein [Terriglobales bacterium]